MIRAVVCAAMALLILGYENHPQNLRRVAVPDSTFGITFSSGDGSSVEQAVVITGEANSSSGMRTGYSWLAQRYPGHKRRSRSLITVGGRFYPRSIRD